MPKKTYSPPTYDLDPQQQQALDLLLAGKTVTETAAALEVARETVSRWKTKDAGFQAAYNAALLSSWEATQKRLLDVRLKALEVLDSLLDAADEAIALKAAAAVLRVDPPKPAGYTDPHKIDMFSF